MHVAEGAAPPETLTVIAVGDLVPSRKLTLDPAMRDFLRGATVTFGNLELTFGRGGYPSEKLFTMRAPSSSLRDLEDLGIDVVSLANNHSMDFGHESLIETIRLLDSVGIRHCGAGTNLKAAETPAIMEVAGQKVALLAWTCLLPPRSAASVDRPGVAPLHVHSTYEISDLDSSVPGRPPRVKARTAVDEADLRHVAGVIRQARRTCNYVFVAIHWGVGDGEEVAEYQVPLAHALIDAGADAVVGGHVHDAQGVATHRGRPVLLSLGNFLEQVPRDAASDAVSEFLDAMSKHSLVAAFQLGSTRPLRLQLLPVVVTDQGTPTFAKAPPNKRRSTTFSS